MTEPPKGRVMRIRCALRNDTDVGDPGLAHLRHLTDLRELDLSRTRVTDAGLVRLRGLTALRRLDLGGTRVTQAGVRKLREALPRAVIFDADGSPGRQAGDAAADLGAWKARVKLEGYRG